MLAFVTSKKSKHGRKFLRPYQKNAVFFIRSHRCSHCTGDNDMGKGTNKAPRAYPDKLLGIISIRPTANPEKYFI
jgi:hypothetical protein